ncbi:MAG: uroporphyrinogen decarboxylase [Bacteroidota bacterium]
MSLQNDLLLRVARGDAVPRPPVWIMRQAGRFLSEYRAVRARAGSFKAMIEQSELAAEVTLQPVDLIGVDAAIIFSDILVLPQALGLDYEMVEKIGPYFPETVRNTADLARLHPIADKSNLDDTLDAIRIVKRELAGRVPLIGFAGAPWTIFAYMTEGKGSKTFSIARRLLVQEAGFSHQLLQTITDGTIRYLKSQIAAGADIVQVFDSWAGLLSRQLFRDFALPYIRQICEAIDEVPVIVFAKGANNAIDLLAALPCQVLGLDWTVEPETAIAQAGDKVFQGNLDPAMIYAQPERIESEVRSLIERYPRGRHIVNLGHGIYPDMPREHVQHFVQTVKAYRYDGP